MKILSSKIRHLLIITFLMSGYQVEIFAQEQEADSIKTKQQGLFVGLSVASYQSLISQEGILSVAGLNSIGKPAISGTVEIGYFLTDHFGISSGINFFSFNSQVTLKAYQNKFNATDTENETYERQVSATNIIEDQYIACLGIPVNLNLRIPLGRKLGFSLRTGIEMAIPVIKNYHSSGIFTYKGYYPRYNVLLESLPAYGFPDKASISADGQLELQPISFITSVCTGLDYSLRKNMQAGIAFCYSKALSDIQSYTSPEKFQLSSDINQISSMMGGSSKVIIQSTGVIFTLRYFFLK